jgi:hypothetical protein
MLADVGLLELANNLLVTAVKLWHCKRSTLTSHLQKQQMDSRRLRILAMEEQERTDQSARVTAPLSDDRRRPGAERPATSQQGEQPWT